MSFVSAIRAHIPYLRRYARILTGSQQSGDAHVRACLEAAVEGNEELGHDLPPQVALFQLFHACWNPELDTSDLQDEATPLSHVTPKARQVMLLTSVEGFSIEDVAKILRIDDAEAQSLLVSAQQELNAGLATRVMIIEDEPVIALDLRAIVENAGHSVTGVARTRDQAVALAQKSPPGLVLADIQLADDSSGIDAVADILREIDVPVIFITAFPERLLTGERPEPAFLISKPYSEDQVRSAVSQAMFFSSTETLKA